MSSDLKKWKVLSSKYLIKDPPWCTVRTDHVVVSNGAEIPQYYVLEYPNWVCVLAITRQKKFIFVLQYRHGLQNEFYELPAGMCDKEDSSPLESAKRELLEETGYGNGNWEEFTVISANPSTHTNLCYCYLATDVEKIASQDLDETEDLQVVKLSLEEVKKLLLEDSIIQSMQLTPLWKYMAINHLL